MAKKKKKRTSKRRYSHHKSNIKLHLEQKTIFSSVAILFFLIALLIILSFTGQGELLQKLHSFLSIKFGLVMLFFPFMFFSAGMVLIDSKVAWTKPNVFLGTVCMMLASLGLFSSGEIGEQLSHNLKDLISPLGAILAYTALIVIGLLVMMQASLSDFLEYFEERRLNKAKQQQEKEVAAVQQEVEKARKFVLPNLMFKKKGSEGFKVNNNHEESQAEENVSNEEQKAIDQKAKPIVEEGLPEDSEVENSSVPMVWDYPPLSLLSNKKGGEADRGDIKANAQTIENTLDSFGIKATVKEVNYGPSVTQYALEITKGTRLSKITRLSTDLALALAAPTGQIRIEAPIAGRSLVGIEVPNYSPSYVTLRQLLSSPLMKKHPSKLAVAMGIDVAGKSVVADISKMPHILIAGATGSGKSVCINSFLCSMLFRASPQELKLILVDPKRVELTGYNGIPHLLTPVIIEPEKVVSALKWACALMDKRYKKLAEVGVRNIDAYNELAGLAAMPSVVIVIDELADIMLFAPKEVEESITRIAQMARAVGIHLVLATQRPSVDVITGLIKANIPARIAFNVSSMMDSRVILDQPGAEKLLGRGDMLFVPPDQAKPSRIQGTFVSDQEAKNLIDFLKSQGQEPQYEDDIISKFKVGSALPGTAAAATTSNIDDKDPKFNEAANLIAKYDKGSSSLIQRRLAVGYARAARILDQLCEAGLVGQAQGSKPREVNKAKVQEYLASLQNIQE